MKYNWRFRRSFWFFLGFLFLYSVFFITGARPASADDFTGSWSGSWVSGSTDSGGIAASITQTGSNLAGNITVTKTDCGTFSNLLLTGSATGNSASFEANAICSLDQSYNELEFTNGTLASNQISGTYVVYSDGDLWDAGSFTINRSTNIITASSGAGGSISPSGSVSVSAGSNKTFSITPSSGYRVLDVKVNGASVGAVSQYTFTSVDANHTITASFIMKAPVAEFSAQPVSGKVPLTVNFTDLSTGVTSTRSWQFGDGSGSASQNPSHTYKSPGKFTVDLSVSGPGGSDTETKTDYIVVEAVSIIPVLPILLDEN